MNKKIIYTGAFRFPDKDAAAARVLSIGKILRQLSYEVIFAGWEEKEREADVVSGNTCSYQGFGYVSMNEFKEERNRNFIQKAFHYLNRGQKTLDWLAARNTEEIFAVIAYNSNSFFLKKLRKFCEKNRILLILDVTEWYDASHLPMGPFGIPALDNRLRMTRINPKIKNIIAISHFLEEYYIRKKCNVVKIPPLIDIHESKWHLPLMSSRKNDEFTLVYAGSPGKKDNIENILKAMLILKNKGISIRLHVYGITEKELYSFLDEVAALLPSQIHCYGKIPQKEVPSQLAKADYSVLLRPDKRFAHAGFSTKLVESMTAGTPVIANNTGEIKTIFEDGKNGFLLDANTAEALAAGITKLLSEEAPVHTARSKNARAYAERHFHYENYITSLDRYLKKIAVY